MAGYSEAQRLVLKNYITTDPVLSGKITGDGTDYAFVAAALNATATPNFWCWKTSVAKSEVTDETSVDNTDWSWSAYIARSQGERDAWREIFSVTGTIDASKDNVRSAMADIFSGGTGAAQRTHLLAIARRKATVAEKLLAAGTGTAASPAVFGWQGEINTLEIGSILA